MADRQVARFLISILAVLLIATALWVWIVYQDSAEGTLHDESGAINEDSVELMEDLSPIDDPEDDGSEP